MFVSLGSIIGSGWLLGALTAAQHAGPASVLSWFLAAFMVSLLALTYAELGATYPVAGGSARFSYYSHGPIGGFAAGWAAWLQAVFIPPIEVLAAISYLNSVGWVNQHFNMINKSGPNAGLLNAAGLGADVALMAFFTTMNLAGAKFLSDSNAVVVIWKTAVPVPVLYSLSLLWQRRDSLPQTSTISLAAGKGRWGLIRPITARGTRSRSQLAAAHGWQRY
jgi:amino acid transporter